MNGQRELPRYQSHKRVWALQIAVLALASTPQDGATITPAEEGYAAFPVDGAYVLEHNPQVGGYYVVYEDGYKSYSPAKAFEEGYTSLPPTFMTVPVATTPPLEPAPDRRVLASHQVNRCNSDIRIEVMDGPGPGGAPHQYCITYGSGTGPTGQPTPIGVCYVPFQNGEIKENGTNGVTHEALLAILEDRLACFQAGPYACTENADALGFVRAAMTALKSRTERRLSRGVEGTMTV